jgi:hypothetical protein
MFTRPEAVRDAQIVDALRRDWRLEADAAGYLAAGFGSHHWVAYSTDADRWFVTVDDLRTKELLSGAPMTAFDALDQAFTLAQALSALGLDWVVAPLSTPDGRVLSRLDDRFSVAVFPHVRGTAHQSYESDLERAAVVALVGTGPHAGPRRDVRAATSRRSSRRHGLCRRRVDRWPLLRARPLPASP